MMDRVSSDDLMSLATERGALPMQVGAIVLLDSESHFDPVHLAAVIAARSRRVPRLGQRLVSVPWGCGRPVWSGDGWSDEGWSDEGWSDEGRTPGSAQVETVRCPEPRGEEGLLALAAQLVCRPLPRDRPLWRAVVVTGVAIGRSAVILVHHHVLADGIAGLAILSALADGVGSPSVAVPDLAPAQALPSWARLLEDATLGRLARLSRFPSSARRLVAAVRVLRPLSLTHAASTSLNRPTGRRREFAVLDLDLAPISRTAHEHGSTVNDVLLVAVATALHGLLGTRGEDLGKVVISMPVSDRRRTDTGELGNHSGVVAIGVRTSGDAATVLHEVSTATRSAKLAPPGVSTALLGPLFRVLALLGVMHWFTTRQHLVHTFVSNLRGPASPLTLAGLSITRVIPLSLTSGNVTVSFTALSYAGRLALTLCADPDTCPDLPVLTDLLRQQLSPTGQLGQQLSPTGVPGRQVSPGSGVRAAAGGSTPPSTPRS